MSGDAVIRATAIRLHVKTWATRAFFDDLKLRLPTRKAAWYETTISLVMGNGIPLLSMDAFDVPTTRMLGGECWKEFGSMPLPIDQGAGDHWIAPDWVDSVVSRDESGGGRIFVPRRWEDARR